MIEDIAHAEFHTPLFACGKSFGNKVEVAHHSGLKIQYDDEKHVFTVAYPDPKTKQIRTAQVPESNCATWETVASRPRVPANEHKTESVEGRNRAQVSTPQSHVFEGQGQGKVRDQPQTKHTDHGRVRGK